MENNIIKIPALNYGNIDTNESILISLGRIANNYRFSLKDPNGHLKALMKEYEEKIDNSVNSLQSRLGIWKKLLGKYYKMTYEDETPGYTYKYVSYIFPYEVIDANNTLWVLEVTEGDNYNGGVKDKSYTVDRDWNYNIYLEEITEEEFREKAIEATKHVIDRRLKRLSEPVPEYKITSDKDELDK